MSVVSVIGLDLAKHVFQIHGADGSGRAVLRKQLRRAQLLEFFGRQPRVWRWRLMPARTSGVANRRGCGTKCGSSYQPT